MPSKFLGRNQAWMQSRCMVVFFFFFGGGGGIFSHQNRGMKFKGWQGWNFCRSVTCGSYLILESQRFLHLEVGGKEERFLESHPIPMFFLKILGRPQFGEPGIAHLNDFLEDHGFL